MTKAPVEPQPTEEENWTLTGAKGMAPGTIGGRPRLLVSVLREGGKAANRSLELEGERIVSAPTKANELLLSDRLVSRFHCVLTLDPRTVDRDRHRSR